MSGTIPFNAGYQLPKAFVAYPSTPGIAEVFRAAIKEINKSKSIVLTSWEDSKVDGKVIISVILENIQNNDLFCSDLTEINANVLFELGYAIARNRRTWLMLDSSIHNAKKDFDELGLLTTVGYTTYTNSDQIVKKFYKSKPHEDLSATILDGLKEGLKTSQRPEGLVYLKSNVENEAGIGISKRIQSSNMRVRIDDPQESLKSLLWYAQNISLAEAVVCHFTPTNRIGFRITNARAAFACGLAAGFEKNLLLLGDSEYLAPVDYRIYMQHYKNSSQAVEILGNWIAPMEANVRRQSEALKTYEEGARLLSELRGFQLQLGDFQAENEQLDLPKYFVETAAFEEALGGRQTIFVGRKGTGKTANLYELTDRLRKDPSNLVCSIKPAEYQIESLVKLFKHFQEVDSKGHVVESLWKYLLYTEIASAAAQDVLNRPIYIPMTEDEKELVRFWEDEKDGLFDDFSIRLERALEKLVKIEQDGNIASTRHAVSEILHGDTIQYLRVLLGKVLSPKKRVAVLIDNLDKSWKKQADIEFLSEFLLGLLSTAVLLPTEFARTSSRKLPVSITIAIFIRSDIFSRIVDQAAEPDKLPYVRLKWEDKELLLRVIESRYAAAFGADPKGMWPQYFCRKVRDVETTEYILSKILARPRDILYLVKEAVSTAVNRGHTKVQQEDILEAEKQYSHYALRSILVENGITIPQLESVLYEFVGKTAIVSQKEIISSITSANLAGHNLQEVIEHLVGLTFLGLEVDEGCFEFSEDPNELKRNWIVSSRLSRKSHKPRRYQIHPAFHSFLEIQG
ncbi:MAG: hypothetical protein WAM91_16075 [Candidatus Acidiferrales bacterium]